MGEPGRIERLRRKLVHGQLRPVIADEEVVLVWAHVQAVHGRGHGLLALTPHRCLLRWTGGDQADAAVPWQHLRGWRLRRTGLRPELSLETREATVDVRLPVSSRARVRRARALLAALGERAPATPDSGSTDGQGSAVDLRAERRGIRGHTRRVGVTLLGCAIILLGILFASPFLPGPGTLTVLAGLAVLAREYDGAREVQQWLKRKAARFLSRRRRQAHTGQEAAAEPQQLAMSAPTPPRAAGGRHPPGS